MQSISESRFTQIKVLYKRAHLHAFYWWGRSCFSGTPSNVFCEGLARVARRWVSCDAAPARGMDAPRLNFYFTNHTHVKPIRVEAGLPANLTSKHGRTANLPDIVWPIHQVQEDKSDRCGCNLSKTNTILGCALTRLLSRVFSICTRKRSV